MFQMYGKKIQKRRQTDMGGRGGRKIIEKKI
jgi:hypothetical protein